MKSVSELEGQAVCPLWAAVVASAIFFLRSLYFFVAASSLALSPVMTGLGSLHVWPSRPKSCVGSDSMVEISAGAEISAGDEVGAAETMAGRKRRSAEATIGESFILIVV